MKTLPCSVCVVLLAAGFAFAAQTQREAPSEPRRTLCGGIDVKSDTAGFDIAPYLSGLAKKVKKNWDRLIPPAARPPQMKKGEVTVEFAILRNGKVANLKVAQSSGDESLDRAVMDAVAESSPFRVLPKGFKGEQLLLRVYFCYNTAARTAVPPSGR